MTPRQGHEPSPWRRAAALLAVATAALDLAVLGAFHVLQPDVDPVTTATNSYVHGTGGAASTVATLAAGVGALALVVALRPLLPGRRAVAGLVLLALFGTTKVVQAFFPIDPEGAATATGSIHNLAGNLAFFTLPFAVVLLGAAITVATGSRAPTILAWAVVATTTGVLAGDAIGVFGLAQRLYLVTAALWVAVAATVLLRRGGLKSRTM